jgi:hypothetical protein
MTPGGRARILTILLLPRGDMSRNELPPPAVAPCRPAGPALRTPLHDQIARMMAAMGRITRTVRHGVIPAGVIPIGALLASTTLLAAPAPDTAPVRPVYPIAKSAQLAVEAIPENDNLTLHIRRATDQSALISDDVKATIDGKAEPVTRQSDGSYLISAAELRGDVPHDIELVVGHDGIHELLSGQLSLPASGSAGGLLGDHKQIAWWILNIVVVLIAVIAISRRKSQPPPDV